MIYFVLFVFFFSPFAARTRKCACCGYRDVRYPAFCDVYAVPWHGQCICDANEHVGGHCRNGQSHIHRRRTRGGVRRRMQGIQYVNPIRRGKWCPNSLHFIYGFARHAHTHTHIHNTRPMQCHLAHLHVMIVVFCQYDIIGHVRHSPHISGRNNKLPKHHIYVYIYIYRFACLLRSITFSHILVLLTIYQRLAECCNPLCFR